jgi:hypothetical protein
MNLLALIKEDIKMIARWFRDVDSKTLQFKLFFPQNKKITYSCHCNFSTTAYRKPSKEKNNIHY